MKWQFYFSRYAVMACIILAGKNVFSQVAPLPDPYTGESKISFVRVWEPSFPEVNGNVVVANTDYDTRWSNQRTVYSDGLGRTIQTVIKKGTMAIDPNWGPNPVAVDLVIPERYDAVGRKQYEYLPFASELIYGANGNLYFDAFQKQANFWQTKYPDESYYYSETKYENSPLGRVEKTLAPGQSWVGAGNGVSVAYDYNTEVENIRIWNIDFVTGSKPVTTQYYPAGKLSKSILTDEKNKRVCTYTDVEGRVILKKVQEKEPGPELEENGYGGWLCTFYVYDDLGQLKSIITPKAVKYLESNSWTFVSDDVYQELCYWYEYDEKGRSIIKHTPGGGQIHLVYDNKDRLVLSQDENQRNRAQKQWSFYLYDILDRSIASGLLNSNESRASMAAFVKLLNNGFVNVSVFTGTNETIWVDNPVAGTIINCVNCVSNCNNCSNVVFNTLNYYDNYNYTGVKSFNTDFSFAPAETNNYSPNYNPYIEATTVSSRTTDFKTGTKTRIIDINYDDGNPYNDVFLASTVYYDDKGRTIQVLSDNAKGAVDYITSQYDYSGEVISTCEKHTMPGTSMSNFSIISKQEYDWIGRPVAFLKKFGSLDYKKISEIQYDDLGRVKSKKLSPDYNGGAGIETLTYDYNIRGWLNGINKDYALAQTSLNQWDHFFGIYLGYDNRDNTFSAPQYNGNITGSIWKTQGDNMPRRYDYEYDNAGRFTKALFVQKEKPTDNIWANNKMDFSVTDIVYDENDNLKQMYQKGGTPGVNTPLYIDKLTYEYKQISGGQWSNQLRRVFDQPDLTASTNGMMGDFKDETYSVNGDDYTFDGNGNLVKDNNKKIRNGSANGVIYNFMDKPQKIIIENKSVTEFTYDADGEKLAKIVTQTATGISNTTWYMGDFIYEESSGQTNLQFILHEEGRIRVYTPVSNPRLAIGGNFDLPDNKKGVFEFFIKDNLENTRAIVTEETHSEYNNCTMEDALAYYEERMFGQIDVNGNPQPGNNEVSATRVDKQTWTPLWNANSSVKISKLNRFSKMVGPNIILKVMAGDNIAAKTDYYYNEPPNNGGGSDILTPLLTSMLSALSYTSPAGSVKGFAGGITSNFGVNPGELGDFLNNQNTNNTTTPQAYLNILFFDENFKFVPYDNVTGLGSYGYRVGDGGDGKSIPLQLAKAPKNGYAFVYVSNQSQTNVFFDNLEVTHVRGRLIEENAYYPYGLKIKGISAKAFDKSVNKYGYQGSFSEEEEETGWNEFGLRMYDPQIGIWTSLDPNDQCASPYLGMGGNPIRFVDPDGGSFVGDMLNSAKFYIGAIAGAATVYLSLGKNVSSKEKWGLTALGFFAGGFLGYATDFRSVNDYINVASGINFALSDEKYYRKIRDDLEDFTDLILDKNEKGILVYEQKKIQIGFGVRKSKENRKWKTIFAKKVRRGNKGSAKARKILVSAIKSERVVDVETKDKHPTSEQGGKININPKDTEAEIKGTMNMDKRTFGWGFSFLHEYMHTLGLFDFSQGKAKDEAPGDVEDILNEIRRQLGPDFGERKIYDPNGGSYIPFDEGSLEDFSKGNRKSTNPQFKRVDLQEYYRAH